MQAVAAAERTAKSAEAVLEQLQTRRADMLKSATMDQVHRSTWLVGVMSPLADRELYTKQVTFNVSIVQCAPAASAGGAAEA